MSLRIFHVIFISVCVLFSILVGAWGAREYITNRDTSALVLALIFFVAAGVLVIYGKKVFGKLRELD